MGSSRIRAGGGLLGRGHRSGHGAAAGRKQRVGDVPFAAGKAAVGRKLARRAAGGVYRAAGGGVCKGVSGGIPCVPADCGGWAVGAGISPGELYEANPELLAHGIYKSAAGLCGGDVGGRTLRCCLRAVFSKRRILKGTGPLLEAVEALAKGKRIDLKMWGELVQDEPAEAYGANERLESRHGLGLALVQRIAQAHGGCIKIESGSEKGCEVTLLFPWEAE